MIEPLLQTAVKQAPILAVTLGALLYVVHAFLRHIREATDRQDQRDAARDALDLARAESLNQLGDECHAVQREAIRVMAALQVTLDANSEALKKNSHCLCEVAAMHRASREKRQAS